jgi:uncharacterized protein
MRYLLDVNALIAFGVIPHQFHQRVAHWIKSLRGSTFMTCSITEIGFIRVVASVPMYQLDVSQARKLLHGMKGNAQQPLSFLTDGNGVSDLPSWVKSPAQTTDGHLLQLAKSNGAALATLDKGIAGAVLIPFHT